MRTFIGVVLLVIVMGVIVQMRGTDVTYVKGDDVTLEVIKEEPKEPWMLDEQAIQAAKDVVKKKELQAELETVNNEIKEKQTRKVELEKELGTY